ncbi:hypothetical protein [Desulfonema magnum]|uniref:hypothetical protein n=1 Tax=Desulfonema magnum TaxID=45655 RepID=UPI001A9B5D3C|nr:hypothetical protein [Desulfonema magnum]
MPNRKIVSKSSENAPLPLIVASKWGNIFLIVTDFGEVREYDIGFKDLPDIPCRDRPGHPFHPPIRCHIARRRKKPGPPQNPL